MQDDDDFDTLKWVDDAIILFQKFSDMVILGGCGGYTIDFDDKERMANVHPDEQCTNLKFVHCVDRAPMWINKNLFMEKLHHIDYSLCSVYGG